MIGRFLTIVFVSIWAVHVVPAQAQDAPTCSMVRFGSVGWLDAGAASSMAAGVLRGLGYTTQIERLSAPVIFNSLKNRNLDVFMEIMVPTMGESLKPYILDNSLELVTENLADTKYTLAVNAVGRDLGITKFADIALKAESLSFALHGTEPGSDGSLLIQRMIDNDQFQLGAFKLISAPERILLRTVQLASKNDQPIVFLAWEPHPMNVLFDITYLSGGDEVFGPDFGGADVYTGLRTGLLQECPNAALLLSRLKFSLPMINEVMTAIMELNAQPLVAAIAWLRQHPEVLETWLKDIVSLSGENGLGAVRAYIGLEGS